eukprot:TRINITY_DN1679_c1_g1_i9.p2 TRINITY_DN1679_c1_g1~~TRINITY_DN1679_c1_g1_i9.p2  ORF type:complete len:508 (-),score=60.11 TRINITY_DN1679_c1_g1_i9:839-2362(-)
MLCAAVTTIFVALIAGLAYQEYLIITALEKKAEGFYTPWKGTFQNKEAAQLHVSEFIQIQTVSNYDIDNHIPDVGIFQQALDYLEKSFPLVWSTFKIEKVNEFSLLMELKGTDASLRPMLYMGHYDVVPVVNETIHMWTYPPFSGAMADGYIWGRGALDMKSCVITVLEALNHLLSEGFKPRRTIYYALGHDEEVGGGMGAKDIAALLKQRGVELELVIDEGSPHLADGLGFAKGPISLVSIAEKGYVSLELDILGQAGHSSMPPVVATTVPSIMSRIISNIDAHPSPVSIKLPVQKMLMALAPRAPLYMRPLLRRADNPLIQPILAYAMAQQSSTAALVRTTAAVTKVQAFVADNVLPQAGKMIVNFRTLPEEGTEAAVAYMKRIIAKESGQVNITKQEGKLFGEPSSFAPVEGSHWNIICQAISEILGEEENIPVVAPFLAPGATDSRYYLDISVHGAYRYMPISFSLALGDKDRIHGVDERIKAEDVGKMVAYYTRIIGLFDQK